MEIETVQAVRALVLGRRERLGLTQAAAAARAGVSRKWLADLESGKATVELGKVLALLEALGVTLHATVRRTVAEGNDIPDDDLDLLLDEYHRES